MQPSIKKKTNTHKTIIINIIKTILKAHKIREENVNHSKGTIAKAFLDMTARPVFQAGVLNPGEPSGCSVTPSSTRNIYLPPFTHLPHHKSSFPFLEFICSYIQGLEFTFFSNPGRIDRHWEKSVGCNIARMLLFNLVTHRSFET